MNELLIGKDERLLVVAPHPDDETIGCGGLLIRYAGQCDVLLLTDGGVGGDPVVRQDEFQGVMKTLQVYAFTCLQLEDGKLSGQTAELCKYDFSPYSKIFVTAAHDPHPDHNAAFFGVANALKMQGLSPTVYQYEVGTPVHDATDYIDVSDVFEKKLSALRQYKSQLLTINYCKTAEGLNSFRGGRAGRSRQISFAEAFEKADLSQEAGGDPNAQRYRRWFQILNKWLKARMAGRSMAPYLKKNNIKKVAIYGFGQLGRRLYEDLNQDGSFDITVIDNKLCRTGLEQKIIGFESFDGKADIVIVTVVTDFFDIRNQICQKFNSCPVANLEELVDKI